MWKALKKLIYDLGQALFWQPLRGGNGKVLMFELSQYVLNVLGVWMLVYEGITPDVQWTENILIATIGFLIAIAGLKEYFNHNDNKNDNNNDG